MHGYDFVERILGQTNYDVRPLIKFAGNSETEWLEFKAASYPSDGKFDKKDNKWDYRWDISKALIGLANHIGGVLILGVSEAPNGDKPPEAFSLEPSGFDGNKDKFMRDVILSQLISPQNGWTTGSSGKLICETIHTVVTPRWGHLSGQPVVVMLVRPRSLKDKWLRATQQRDGIEKNLVLCRAKGDFGATISYPEEKVEEWWNSRDFDRVEFNQQYQVFLEQWSSSSKKPESETNSVIRQHLSALLKESRDFEGVFAPDMIGGSGDGGHFLTEADEFDNSSAGVRSRNAPARSVETVLNSPRTVLLGEPGGGKSTCFRIAVARLAESWLTEPLEPGMPWGMLVGLNEFGESGLRATILRKLQTLHWIDIESRLASGEMILFLDALNECPVARYVECCQDIAAMLTLYPGARIHITSRVTHNPLQFRLPTYQIRPMNRTQQGKFLEIYLGSSIRAAEVLSHIYRQPGAVHFASSPIMLRIVAGICQDTSATLPTGMANLYKQFLQKWFERELEKNLVTGTPELWSFNRLVEALALLAFRMQEAGLVSCSIEFARQSIFSVIGTDYLARFLDQMAQGMLLKKDRQDEYLQFSHQTIQEYFAAEYLASHPEVLRAVLDPERVTKQSSDWFLSLVLAFELIERPSRDFLEAAWAMEPLLVAVALRDDKQLLRLPLHGHPDLWLRGTLRAMRGEDAAAEMRELAFISRIPPKYPLPERLINSLRSTALWYAGESHPNGALRLERLQKFLLDRDSMWIETIPYIADVQPRWLDYMSTAQKSIAGDQAESTLQKSIKLNESTVIELCTLLRYEKISKAQFASCWRDALTKDRGNHQESNLLALIRTAREFKDRTIRINLGDLEPHERETLSQIGQHWKLSLRLLNFLIREGFSNVDSLRADPGRIEDIVERISPMNMYRFLKAKILRPEDIPASRLHSLSNELQPRLAQELVRGNLLVHREIADSRFFTSALEESEHRKKIELELLMKDWDVTVSNVIPSASGTFGFINHPRLNEDAFIYFDRIDNPNGRTIQVGDTLCVRLKVEFNKKKGRWGYAVKSGAINSAKINR
jgi:hypothetical protein